MSRFQLASRLVLGVALIAILAQGMKLGLERWNESHRERLAESIRLPSDVFGADAPRRRNGTFDFTKALNQRSAGVAKEDNAAIPLLRIVQVGDQPPRALREETLRTLQVNEEEMPRVETTGLNVFLQSKNAGELWSTVPGWDFEGTHLPNTHHQLIRDWVVLQEPVLEVISRAAERSDFFLPFVNWDEELPLNQQQLNLIPNLIEICNVSASVEMEKGDVRMAIKRVIDGHHLTRLMMRNPMTMHISSCFWDEFAILEMEELLVRSEQMSAADCEDLLKRLQRLPEIPRVSEMIDTGYRVWIADEVLGYEILRLPTYGWEVEPLPVSIVLPPSLADTADMVSFNKRRPWIERPAEDMTALMDIFSYLADEMRRDEFVRLTEQRNLPLRLTQIPEGASDWMGLVTKVCDYARDRKMGNDIRLQLLKLSLHIEIFRHQTGQLPEHLEDLSTEDVVTLLNDPYGDSAVRYRCEDGHYLLYSVGRNAFDDGGRADDIAVGTIVLE